jgi:hypothetical protein
MSKRSLPWLQFYPADWESDSVAGCTLAAQGLWLRMICVMHTSRSYGCLETEGKPTPDEVIFRRCGCVSVEEYRALLTELFSAGVPARREDGVIYSRRMVRDQQERESAAERQRRHRSHAPVTPMSRVEVRSQKSNTEKDKVTNRTTKPAAPVDLRRQPFIEYAHESYTAKHGTKPLWQGKDFKTLQTLLRHHSPESLPLERLKTLWEHFAASTEPFTAKQGDSLAYFCANLGKFSDGPILAAPGKAGTNGIRIDNLRGVAVALQDRLKADGYNQRMDPQVSDRMCARKRWRGRHTGDGADFSENLA